MRRFVEATAIGQVELQEICYGASTFYAGGSSSRRFECTEAGSS